MEPEAEGLPRPESESGSAPVRSASEPRYEIHWRHNGDVCRMVSCGPGGEVEASLLFECDCTPGKDPQGRYRVEAVLAWALRELVAGTARGRSNPPSNG